MKMLFLGLFLAASLCYLFFSFRFLIFYFIFKLRVLFFNRDMAAESIRKVQDILFRGGLATPSPPGSRPDSVSVSETRPDPGLTIQIPNSVAATPQKAPFKTHSRRGSSESLSNSKPQSYRELLKQKLGDKYRGAERFRLEEDGSKKKHWKRWGPYVSDRQWVRLPVFSRRIVVDRDHSQATVREDYSSNGDAWSNFPHEHARSRAYRWGEDGIAGISDNHQRLCFAVSFWNGADPILKERLFGLTGHQGNHGEDVKELYYYLDSTPTHSYMKFLYKYPQRRYPYEELVAENAHRTREVSEYEILDTDAFDEDRYWDIFVEVCNFVTFVNLCFQFVLYSMRKIPPMTSSFAAPRITAAQTLPHFTSFLSCGLGTLGRGLPSSPRCRPFASPK
jgi:hypothetical protein